MSWSFPSVLVTAAFALGACLGSKPPQTSAPFALEGYLADAGLVETFVTVSDVPVSVTATLDCVAGLLPTGDPGHPRQDGAVLALAAPVAQSNLALFTSLQGTPYSGSESPSPGRVGFSYLGLGHLLPQGPGGSESLAADGLSLPKGPFFRPNLRYVHFDATWNASTHTCTGNGPLAARTQVRDTIAAGGGALGGGAQSLYLVENTVTGFQVRSDPAAALNVDLNPPLAVFAHSGHTATDACWVSQADATFQVLAHAGSDTSALAVFPCSAAAGCITSPVPYSTLARHFKDLAPGEDSGRCLNCL